MTLWERKDKRGLSMLKHVMIILEQKVRRHPKLHTILPPTKEFKRELPYLHLRPFHSQTSPVLGHYRALTNYLHRVAVSLDLSLCLSVTVLELSSCMPSDSPELTRSIQAALPKAEIHEILDLCTIPMDCHLRGQ